MRLFVHRLLVVLVGSLCCLAAEGASFVDRADVAGGGEPRECGVLASEYACQVACAHRDNSSAERVAQVRVPVSNVSGVSV